MKLPSIQQAVQDSGRTFLRFPLVLIAAAAGTVCALILVDYEGPHAATILFNILWAAILGIPLLTGVRLAAEKKKWTGTIRYAADSVALILLIGYAFSVPSNLADAPESISSVFWSLPLPPTSSSRLRRLPAGIMIMDFGSITKLSFFGFSAPSCFQSFCMLDFHLRSRHSTIFLV